MADPLNTASELTSELRGSNPPLVLDLRPAELFAQAHIPGAIHLDLWGVSLIDTSDAPLRAFMWMIGHLFSIRGVTAERPVVVYEADSGVRAWQAAGHGVTTDVVSPVPSTWHGMPDASRLATWQEVRDKLNDPRTAILDTRSEAEYFGELVRAKRGGAIPGAIHIEWKRNLRSDGTFKSPQDLAAMYSSAGISPDREVLTYCQGGYRAAHAYLALRLLGFPRVRNYTGSWKEWGDREDLPIEHPHRDA
jgi:thiosulfate/3-mercaptopyruvate sulfurtransferase